MRLEVERRGVLSLGANLGDRQATLDAAVRALAAIDGIRVLARSGLWESPAWHPDGEGLTPDYLNLVLAVGVTVTPEELLAATRAVETALGRTRAARFAARTIDIDLVTVGDERRQTPGLTLPHPRAHERQFVLQPWLEVEPDAQLPGHGSVAELAEYAAGDVWRFA